MLTSVPPSPVSVWIGVCRSMAITRPTLLPWRTVASALNRPRLSTSRDTCRQLPGPTSARPSAATSVAVGEGATLGGGALAAAVLGGGLLAGPVLGGGALGGA